MTHISEDKIDVEATKIFDKAKAILKADVYMKFYYERKPLYLEKDTSGV